MSHGKFCISLVITVIAFRLLAQDTNHKDMGGFLSISGTKVRHSELKLNLGFFLDNSYYKNNENFTWHLGSIEDIKGKVYSDISIKFNTLNNSVYVKQDSIVYRINTTSLNSFTIKEAERNRTFHKGFYSERSTTVKSSFALPNKDVLRYMISYPKYKTLDINELKIDRNDSKTELIVDLKNARLGEVYDFKNFLARNANALSASVEATDAEVNENTFLEVLFQGDDFFLLKRNFKRIGSTESVSLVQHAQLPPFAENTYYLARKNKELTRMIFTKSSIKKGLDFVDHDPKKVPSLRNEKKLIKWLEENGN